MKMLNATTKTELAVHLRAHADGPDLLIASVLSRDWVTLEGKQP